MEILSRRIRKNVSAFSTMFACAPVLSLSNSSHSTRTIVDTDCEFLWAYKFRGFNLIMRASPTVAIEWLRGLTVWQSLLLVAACVITLNATGFCFYRLSFLSTTTLYEIAIANQSARIADFVEKGVSSPSEYLTKMPSCCSYGDYMTTGIAPSLGIFGWKSYAIRLVYRQSAAQVALAPNDGDFYEAFMEITSCGHVIRKTGQRIHKPT
jgi:hypothetical protein